MTTGRRGKESTILRTGPRLWGSVRATRHLFPFPLFPKMTESSCSASSHIKGQAQHSNEHLASADWIEESGGPDRDRRGPFTKGSLGGRDPNEANKLYK